MTPRPDHGERGSALMTALLASIILLALGLALLAIVDVQAEGSATERTRDRGFNLAESVLTGEAFVLGRNWPASAVTSGPGSVPIPLEQACSAPGAVAEATLGATLAAGTTAALLQPNLNATYTDTAYTGATWKVNVCDDDGVSTVWNEATLANGTKNWDKNDNKLLWVRAQATVEGRTRSLAGLVRVASDLAFNPKYGLVSGSVTDDLGTSINALSNDTLNGVLGGLLGAVPTVAADPSLPATAPPSSGVTGLRCGALDVSVLQNSTCVSGTIAALSDLPLAAVLLNASLEQFPASTAATPTAIAQLRAQAVSTRTYYKTSSGAATSAAAPACSFTTNTGTRSASSVVFVEQVGTGDQYCFVDVSAGVQWKALVVGSGRVVLRGSNTATTPPSATVTGPQPNTFSGVVYALNQQRLPAGEGGMGLGDATVPGREVLRIENWAHVKGGVNADGKSGRVTIIPPAATFSTNALVDQLLPCVPGLAGVATCLVNATVKALGGVTAVVDGLVNRLGLAPVTAAILNIVKPQREAYGSAMTADVAAVKKLTVYGASGVVPGTFQDLQPTR